MTKFLSGLFPFPWYLSLGITWLLFTTLNFLVGFVSLLTNDFQRYFHLSMWIIGLFAPIDVWVPFYTYAGFVMLLDYPMSAPGEAYFFCAVPLLTLILIFGGDWAMQKVRIPRTPIKILYNIVFLFTLTVLVHMALWQTWKPWAVFTQRMIAP